MKIVLISLVIVAVIFVVECLRLFIHDFFFHSKERVNLRSWLYKERIKLFLSPATYAFGFSEAAEVLRKHFMGEDTPAIKIEDEVISVDKLLDVVPLTTQINIPALSKGKFILEPSWKHFYTGKTIILHDVKL